MASRSKFCPCPRPCPRRFVLGLGLEYLSSTCPCTFYLGLVKLFVMLVLIIFLSLQRFDRELDDSNNYVTKLTMPSTVYLLIVSSVWWWGLYFWWCCMYSNWFYFLTQFFSGLERLSSASSSASKICPCSRPHSFFGLELVLASKDCPRPRRRPRRFVLVLVLKDLSSASALASRICPRLTSLIVSGRSIVKQEKNWRYKVSRKLSSASYTILNKCKTNNPDNYGCTSSCTIVTKYKENNTMNFTTKKILYTPTT